MSACGVEDPVAEVDLEREQRDRPVPGSGPLRDRVVQREGRSAGVRAHAVAAVRDAWRARRRRRRSSGACGSVLRRSGIGTPCSGFARTASSGPLEEDPVYGPIVREAIQDQGPGGLHAATRTTSLSRCRPQLGHLRRKADSALSRLPGRGGAWQAGQPRSPFAADHCGDLRGRSERVPKQRRRSGDYVLSGIARCAGCGGRWWAICRASTGGPIGGCAARTLERRQPSVQRGGQHLGGRPRGPRPGASACGAERQGVPGGIRTRWPGGGP